MPRLPIRLTPYGSSDDLSLEPGLRTVAISSIRLRIGDYTRPLNAAHVVTLAESIAVLGLLEPIIIDTTGRLLAGGHRLAALQLLVERMPIARRQQFLKRCGHTASIRGGPPRSELGYLADRLAFLGPSPLTKDKIPAQVEDVSGRSGPTRALAIEAAENNVRRQYTPDEVAALAERFKAAGYKTTSGKPKAGEPTMLGALEAAVGRSKRQIQRILDGPIDSGKSEWDKAVASLQRAAARVIKAGSRKQSEEAKAVVAVAERVGKILPG